MGYEYITKYDSPNFTRGREGNKPQYIVIHHWGVDGQSFWGVVNWLCRQGGNSSAHYVVEAGKVACIVDPDDTAWHAGNWWYNLRSIGIECRPEMSAGDLATVAELIREIWKAYGKLPIIGHKDIVATACPGRYYAKLSTLKSMAEGGNISAPPAPTPKPNAGKSIDTLVKEVLQGMWGNGQARFDALKRAGYNPQTVQDGVNARILGTTTPPARKATKSTTEIAQEVLAGNWGVGSDRVARLTNAGYNYNTVQAEVNRLCGLKVPTGKTIDQVAREVIRGDWGNGSDRQARLTRAGYNYQAVQARVNQLLA